MKQEMKPQTQSEDSQDLFTYLPSEIILNILLRIPTRTVMSCKCVCKAWRDLLKTREFVQSHLSKSVPGLAVCLEGENSNPNKIVKFLDEHRLSIVLSVDFPFRSGHYIVYSSVDGLLFVCNRYNYPRDLFICNPINQEYIRIPNSLPNPFLDSTVYGFGVSKMSGEYKVVRVLDAGDCQVYTVGTGLWRRIAFDEELLHVGDMDGAFLNGNLHWWACKGFYDLISCLDLETEQFSTFSPPRGDDDYSSLSVLGDYLCVCSTFVDSNGGIDIWLMKEYGDEKSWAKEFHIYTGYCYGSQLPIKVFEDGDILMEWRPCRCEMNTMTEWRSCGCKLLYYSNKSETIGEVDLSEKFQIYKLRYIDASFLPRTMFTTVYTPSFLSLKTFSMENINFLICDS